MHITKAAFEAQELPGELETQQAFFTRPMKQQKLWDEATEMGRFFEGFFLVGWEVGKLSNFESWETQT